MILAQMYHQVESNRAKYSNTKEMLREHFLYIKQHFKTIFPHQKPSKKLSIIITFDDGYYSFYKYVFPLLLELELKAIVAVCPKYIVQDTTQSEQTRLSIPYDKSFQCYELAPFCTAKELVEMDRSGVVEIASHSYSHIDLTRYRDSLEYELKESKFYLENLLQKRVRSFVFPFGKYDAASLREARKYYDYIFRIGGAINFRLKEKELIYRVNCDNLKTPNEPYKSQNLIKYALKRAIKGAWF